MKRHYPWLDTLRALAMLMVLLSHYRNALFPAFADLKAGGWMSSVFYSCTRWGHAAVIVFFVLSGFLVGGRMIRQVRERTFSLHAFSVGRFWRILVPLWGAVVLVMCLNVIGIHFSWKTTLGNAFCLQGLFCESLLGPWWALSVEVWFYAWAAAVAFLFCSVGWWKMGGVLSVVLMSIPFMNTGVWFLLIWIVAAITSLTVAKSRSCLRLFFSFLVLLTGLCVSQRCNFSPRMSDFILGACMCPLMREIVMWEPQSGGVKAIDRMGTFFSKFSYSVYLVHMAVMIVLMNGIFAPSANCNMIDRAYFGVVGNGSLYPVFDALNIKTFGLYIGAVGLAFVVSYVFYLAVEYLPAQMRNGRKRT